MAWVIEKQLSFAAILLLAAMFGCSPGTDGSCSPKGSLSTSEPGHEVDPVRELFAVFDYTLEDGLYAWSDTPVFVLYSDGQSIFIDPKTCRQDECTARYLESHLSADQLREVVRKLGINDLRREYPKPKLVDVSSNGWDMPQTIIRFWTGEANRQVCHYGLSISEVYEACNVDPEERQGEQPDYEVLVEPLWVLATRTPAPLLTTFRFLSTFRPESARPWEPSAVDVFMRQRSPNMPASTVIASRWPSELPPLKTDGVRTKWHGEDFDGSMRIKGEYVPTLLRLGKPGEHILLGDDRIIVWRYVLPHEEPYEHGDTGRRASSTGLGWLY